MKNLKIFSLFIAVILGTQLFFAADYAFAASKTAALEEEDLKKIEESTDELVKKLYSSSLFSPEDAKKLVDIKTKLNTVMNSNLKDPIYARLFFDVGYICKEREYNDEAIQYFKLVNEKFSNTSYAQRALGELNKLGVNTEPEKQEGEEDESKE